MDEDSDYKHTVTEGTGSINTVPSHKKSEAIPASNIYTATPHPGAPVLVWALSLTKSEEEVVGLCNNGTWAVKESITQQVTLEWASSCVTWIYASAASKNVHIPKIMHIYM